jgi:hypothetical protein
MQSAAGAPATCSAVLGLIASFFLGLHALYYQNELNKLWTYLGGAPEGTVVMLPRLPRTKLTRPNGGRRLRKSKVAWCWASSRPACWLRLAACECDTPMAHLHGADADCAEAIPYTPGRLPSRFSCRLRLLARRSCAPLPHAASQWSLRAPPPRRRTLRAAEECFGSDSLPTAGTVIGVVAEVPEAVDNSPLGRCHCPILEG